MEADIPINCELGKWMDLKGAQDTGKLKDLVTQETNYIGKDKMDKRVFENR